MAFVTTSNVQPNIIHQALLPCAMCGGDRDLKKHLYGLSLYLFR